MQHSSDLECDMNYEMFVWMQYCKGEVIMTYEFTRCDHEENETNQNSADQKMSTVYTIISRET